MWHVNDKNEKEICRAKVKPCKYRNFNAEKEVDLEIEKRQKQQEKNLFKKHRKAEKSTKSDNTTVDNVSIFGSVQPMKDGSYYGIHIPAQQLSRAINTWRTYVGSQACQQMEAEKEKRDGNHKYHVTVITSKEARFLHKNDKKFRLSRVKSTCRLSVALARKKGDNEKRRGILFAPHLN